MSRLRVLCAAVAIVAGVMPTAVSSARSAPAAPGRVAHARVSATSSTSATIVWTNPLSRTFRGTEVRVARGTRAPATPTSGRRVARVARTHRSVTLSRLLAGTTYSVALFTSDGHGHYSRPVATRVVTAPGPVTSLQAFDDGAATVLRWTPPRTRSLRRIVVRYSAGTVAPRTPASGHDVRLTSALARSARVTGLAKDSRYAVSVFALDGARRASTPAITRFLTLADPATDGTLTGRVTDAGGDPLYGVDVSAESVSVGDSVAHTTTGVDGRWSLALQADEWFLDFGGQHISGGASDATGYLPGSDAAEVVAGRTVDAGTESLDAGAAVRGRVVDESGAPVAGAPVGLMPANPYVSGVGGSSGGVFFASTGSADGSTTAQDGTYVVRGVPGDVATRWCAGSAGDNSGVCSRTTTVPVVGSVSTVPDLVKSQHPSGALHGRVLAAGRPLAGVSVYVTPTDDNDEDLSFGGATSAADGTYDLGGLIPGRYTLCAESTPGGTTGYATTCRTSITVVAGQDLSRDLPMRTGAAISGVVTGPGGRAIAGAPVAAGTAGDDDAEFDTLGITDRHGHYRITGLDSAAQTVCIQGAGPLPGLPTGVVGRCTGSPVAVQSGVTRSDVDVSLGAGAAIGGRVLDSAGKPVTDVVLDISPTDETDDDFATGNEATVVTDAQGNFVAGGLHSGTFIVCVVDIFGGEGAVVTSSSTDCNGVRVRTRIGARSSVVLHVAQQHGVTVTVRDTDGNPVAGVDATAVAACTDDGSSDSCAAGGVALFDPHAHTQIAASDMTDGSGVADLRELPAGHYAVCLFAYYATTASGGSPTGYADRCSGSSFDVTVTSTSSASVSLVLSPGGVITGRITDHDGAPLRDAKIRVPSSSSTDYPGAGVPELEESSHVFSPPGTAEVSAGDGTYTVTGVIPGERTVCVVLDEAGGGSSAGGYLDQCVGGPPDSQDGGTPVTVTASATTSGVDLQATAGSGISGRVTAGGRVAQGADVLVFAGRDGDGIVDDASTGADGRWTVRSLPAGSYTVCVIDQDSDDDETNDYLAQCWKNVTWDYETTGPPLARATLVPTTAGAIVPGIDAALTRRR